jgi:hypothetical protein
MKSLQKRIAEEEARSTWKPADESDADNPEEEAEENDIELVGTRVRNIIILAIVLATLVIMYFIVNPIKTT